MTNNELSRKVLAMFSDVDKAIKFKTMVDELKVDARTLFKQLFYLEEHNLVQLSTSYPTDAVYPQIHLIRLRKAGKELLQNPAKLDAKFTPTDISCDTSPHIPPDIKERQVVSIEQIIDQIKDMLEHEEISDKKKNDLRAKLNELKSLPLARQQVRF